MWSHTKDMEVCGLVCVLVLLLSPQCCLNEMLTQALLLALYCTFILNYNINLDIAATESNGVCTKLWRINTISCLLFLWIF